MPRPPAEEESEENRSAAARSVYERALKSLRTTQSEAKEEAVLLLEAWKEFEEGATCG